MTLNRVSTLFAAIVVLALATAVWANDASPASAKPSRSAKPFIWLASSAPLTVKGVGWGKFERVNVRFSIGKATKLRAVRATKLGAFKAIAPPSLVYDPCTTLTVTTVGATKGHSALLRLPKRTCTKKTS